MAIIVYNSVISSKSVTKKLFRALKSYNIHCGVPNEVLVVDEVLL